MRACSEQSPLHEPHAISYGDIAADTSKHNLLKAVSLHTAQDAKLRAAVVAFWLSLTVGVSLRTCAATPRFRTRTFSDYFRDSARNPVHQCMASTGGPCVDDRVVTIQSSNVTGHIV